MDMQSARDIIYLASCAVNETMPDPERVAAMDLDAVYRLARGHSTASRPTSRVEYAARSCRKPHVGVKCPLLSIAMEDKL